jgi:hypothetical protein
MTANTIMQSRHVACGVLSFALLAAHLSAQEPGPAPEGLIAKSTSPTAVRLTWTMAPGATTFTVYRGASADGPFQPIGTVKQYATLGVKPTAGQEPVARPLNFLDAGATPQSTLYYRVTALSDFENPGTSETVSVTTPAQPVAPANFGVTYGAGTILDFRWSPVAGASYKLVRALASDGSFAEVPGTQYANNSWARDYNTVKVGETYLYKLRAFYPNAGSAESQVLRVTIVPTPPGVSYLRATSTATGASTATVVLTWGPAPGARSYGILRGKGSEPLSWIMSGSAPLSLPGTTSSFADPGLSKNSTYRYSVTTRYEPGLSGETAGVTVTTVP